MRKSADHDRIRKAMWALPATERVAMLACSVMQQSNGDGVAQIKGLINLLGHMTHGVRVQGFGVAERTRAANCLRDLADQLEHQPQSHEVKV
jgi:hypothetical protein